MSKLGDTVVFHTVHGDCAAIVIGHGDGEYDTELAVFANDQTKGSETGLTADVNQRWSKESTEAGGFTP